MTTQASTPHAAMPVLVAGINIGTAQNCLRVTHRVSTWMAVTSTAMTTEGAR